MPRAAAATSARNTHGSNNGDLSKELTAFSNNASLNSTLSASESMRRSNSANNMTWDALMKDPRKLIRKMMRDPKFDFAIGIVILSNCFTIGLEQSWDLEGKDTTVLEWLEHVYLTIYILELGFRFFGFGIECLVDNWVKFDLVLVVLGVITGWILPPALGQIDELGPLMVLRTARLGRLARTVRLLVKFRELWMLVRGLLNSASTMFYTMVMLFIIIYLFSCMSIEIITNHALATGPNADPAFKAFVDEHFGSLPLTMMTLLQFASLDNMSLIYMPLVRKSWWLAFFFILVILVISIALMNLITAVVVNSALDQAASDKEAMKYEEDKQRKKMMKELRKLFLSLDNDNSGCVSKEEMEAMKPEDKQLFRRILGTSDPMEVFMQLDVDGDERLEIEEFCQGIWQVVSSKVSIEFLRLEKQVNSLKHLVQGNTASLEMLVQFLNPIMHDDSDGGSKYPSEIDSRKFVSEGSRDGKDMPPEMSRQISQSSGKDSPAHRFRDKFDTSLVAWKAKIIADLENSNPLSTKLQEISIQMQQVVRELRIGDAINSHVNASSDVSSERGDCHSKLRTTVDTMPRWAEEARHQLFSIAESIRRATQERLPPGSIKESSPQRLNAECKITKVLKRNNSVPHSEQIMMYL